jgi:hypothetical protein
MKDWKWASVRGWPERMMAARSHSMSSARLSALAGVRGAGQDRTLVKVALVEVVWAGDVHVVETCDLQSCHQYTTPSRQKQQDVRCGGL